MKHKIAFAMIMGAITTGIISFSVISFNVGAAYEHLGLWLRSWLLAYSIVIPVILVVSPMVDRLVKSIFRINS